ncbi:MAG: hypothetical protein PHY27_13525, partial [Parabacteroides sp.]|nr:hypothetical protein [Parabacteroides sp.]
MKQLVVYYVPTYMPESKLTYKRHKNQIMTDDRVCCENIAGGNVCNCERDEGRPLVTVLQEMVTNQCMLL